MVIPFHPGEGGSCALLRWGPTRRSPDGQLDNGIPALARRAPSAFLRRPGVCHALRVSAEHQPQRTPAVAFFYRVAGLSLHLHASGRTQMKPIGHAAAFRKGPPG